MIRCIPSRLLPLAACLVIGAAARADSLVDGGNPFKVKPVIAMKARAFPLEDVQLHVRRTPFRSPFQPAMNGAGRLLASLEPEPLLYNFRVQAGLPAWGTPPGGWEDPRCELRGHFTGHCLSAFAMMRASSSRIMSPKVYMQYQGIHENAHALVAGLAACQAKLGSGYLSAFPEEYFDRLEAGQPVWAPYYVVHRLLAGLLDMYTYDEDRRALEVCRKLADWVIVRTARLSDEQMQRMLLVEHGGMSEVLADLYAVTGEAKYLKMAQRFNHMAVLGPAARREDRLTGLHANTQVPKFLGAARQYELTGQEPLKTAATFFWQSAVRERAYVIGGIGQREYFTPKESLSRALGPHTCETCCTSNLLKLTRHLFCWEPKAEYADYCERALYNHILAAQDPTNGRLCFFLPLGWGSKKSYGGLLDSCWCCTGAGLESHARHGESIYFHDGDQRLFVNLFVASMVEWGSKGLSLHQQTNYPEDAATRLAFTCQRPVELAVHVRHPWWATAGLKVRVNGQPHAVSSSPGSYAVVTRTWKTGDVLDVLMPFVLRTEAFRDNPRRFAVLHGPLVLCAEVDPKQPPLTVAVEPAKWLASLKPVPGRFSAFTAPAEMFRPAGQQNGKPVTLEPFYTMHGGRCYTVYWDER